LSKTGPAELIPRIFHYCWYGPNEGTLGTRQFIDTWKKTNPSWEIWRWDEHNSPVQMPYVRRALETSHWADASNAVRLYVLEAHGGVYLDTDVELVRDFEQLRRYPCFLGFQYDPRTGQYPPLFEAVNNAVLGAVPHHPFIKRALETLVRDFDGTEEAHLSSPQLMSKLLIRAGLRQYSTDTQMIDGVAVFPKEVFYPYYWREAPPAPPFSDKTYAVHHWAHRW
jgi:mannosyltransferase OCH1-like enzyme